MKLRIKKATLRKGYAYLAILSLIVNSFSPFFASYQYVYAEDLGAEESAVADSGDDGVADESSDEGDAKEEDATPPEESTEPEEESNQEQSILEETVTEPTDETQQEDILPDGVSDYRPEEPTETTEPTETVTDTTDSLDPVVNIVEPKEEIDEVEKVCIGDDEQITESVKEDWTIDSEKGYAETKEKVKLGVKYIFPEDEKVTLTFTCLPEDDGDRSDLRIQKVLVDDLNLPEEFSTDAEYAYDITTDMNNGDFEYDLTLPKPEGSEVEVAYIEKDLDAAKEGLSDEDIKLVNTDKVDQEQDKDDVKIEDLDHFTIFIPVLRTNVLKIMPLGDSITKGSGVCYAPDTYLNCTGYRNHLWNMLVENGFDDFDFVGSQGGTFQYQYTHDNNHEGHGGWTPAGIEGSVYGWLETYKPDIVLLHIGTNDLNSGDVEDILDKIDDYETDKSVDVDVILALIINRKNGGHTATSNFNDAIETMALARIGTGDDIKIVDMENGAGINYVSDMVDPKHPNDSGYQKMAAAWYNALTNESVDPSCSAGIQPISSITATGVSGPNPIMLKSVTVGSGCYTINVENLYTGTGSGVGGSATYPVQNADNFNINNFANTLNPHDIVLFNGDLWVDTNGNNPDFYIFENGGNDDGTIAAIFPDGSFGNPISFNNSSHWGDTGYNSSVSNQDIKGMAFAITDLLDGSGNHLTNDTTIKGLRIASGGLDPSSVSAVVVGEPQLPCVNTVSGLGTITATGDAGIIQTINYGANSYASSDLDLGLTKQYLADGTEVPLAWDLPGADGFSFNKNAHTTDSTTVYLQTMFAEDHNTFFVFENGGNDDANWYGVKANGTLTSGIFVDASVVATATGYKSGFGGDLKGFVFVTCEAVRGIRIEESSSEFGFDAQSISAVPLEDDPPAEQVCPSDGDWDKVEDLSGLSYTYTAASEKLVAETCYKAGTSVVYSDVNPDASPVTVNSTVWNKDGCPDAAGCNYLDLSHASFRLVDVPLTGSVEVTKVVNWGNYNPDTNQSFEICITNSSDFSECKDVDYDGGVVSWNELTSDHYSITETDPGSNWTVDGSFPINVSVSAGSSFATTINNTYNPVFSPLCETPTIIGFNDLQTGEWVTNQYSHLGLIISAENNSPLHPNKAIIFDSANPSSSDQDLRTPGYGPGNLLPQGNILIIAQDDLDISIPYGFVDSPNDESAGGILYLYFDSPTDINGMGLLDIEETGGEIRLYDEANSLIDTITIFGHGDNSYQTINILTSDVKRMEVEFVGSGAITHLSVCPTAYCGDGVVNVDEQCDDGNTNDGDGCSASCQLESSIITVVAHKVVCDNESYLPNWGYGIPNDITENTAQTWVNDSNGHCQLIPDWQFQWSYDGVGNPGDNIGEAGTGWNTFGTAGVDITDLGVSPTHKLWFREVMQNGYLPFSYGSHPDNSDNVSAEFYCNDDGLNYDNWEWIDNPQYGETYHCVAFNFQNTPEIAVDKQGPEFVEEGEPITYTYAVTNPGNVALSNVSVTDDKCSPAEYQGGDANSNSLLEVGETWNYSCTTTPTWVFNTQLTNTSTATGYYINTPVQATDQYNLYSFILRKDVQLVGGGNYDDPNTQFDVNALVGDRLVDSVKISEATPAKMWVAGGSYDFCEVNMPSGYTPHYTDGCLTFHTGTYADWTQINYIEPITIIASKIVCDNESDLPNWGNGPSNNITEITAQRWVNASNGRCSLVPGWKFQWGDDADANPGDGTYGEVAGWNTFGATDANGKATAIITDLDNTSQIKVREVLQDGYIPFTYTTSGNTNSNDVSAEIYCDTDVLNYDNDDRITNPQYGQTYYCVAFNTKLGSITIIKDAINNDGQDFRFTSTGGLGTFILDDDGNNNNTRSNTKVYPNAPAGTYTVTEDPVNGWKLTGLVCSGNSTTDINSRTATINLGSGEDVLCTFTNSELGSISGFKYNDRDGDNNWDTIFAGEHRLNGWRIFIDGNNNQIYDIGEKSSVTSGWFLVPLGNYSLDNVVPGTHEVCEVMKSGWFSSMPGNAVCKTVTLGAGENKQFVNFGNHEDLRVVASKVVCENEADLPNWSDDSRTYRQINASTAQDWVTRHTGCKIVDGWEFEWGQENANNPGDSLVGNGGDGWTPFGPTVGGVADVSISNITGNRLEFREVLQPDYIPFTFGVNGNNRDNVSAEFYCSADVENYDNWDFINNPKYGNTYYCVGFNARSVRPVVRISKWNETGGVVQSIGNIVRFNIKVWVEGTEIENVKLTDLLPEGFDFIEGSGEVRDYGNNLMTTIDEPIYASPGTWDLGTLTPEEPVTISYSAKILEGVSAGLHKDIAWAVGDDLGGGRVLGLAYTEEGEEEGYLATNFVGTAINIDVEVPASKAKAEVDEEEREEEVLGASTMQLPATGASTAITIFATFCLITGVAFIVLSKKKKFCNLLLVTILFSVLSTSKVSAAENIMVLLQEPVDLINQPLNLSFVVMDTSETPVGLSAQCWKDGPDTDWVQFGAALPIDAGGNTDVCDVNSSVLSAEGYYEFKVVVAGVDSNIVSTTYDKTGPDKPKYIEVDRKSDCKYEVEFKTANDGQTSHVEVYMKDDKEYTANASTRIRTISIGPNTKYEFTIEVSGDECSHRQYFAVRAFDAAGNASKVEAEELVNVTTVTVQGEETETEGAIYGGGSFTISGEGAEGAEVVTSEDEIPGVEGEEGSILGERTEDEEGVEGEQGFIGKVFSSPWTWIAIIAAVGGIVINGIRKSKK